MHRWHESGCQRPDVSAASGIPYCTYCFAISSSEEQLVVPQSPPELQDRSQMNLSWPSTVTYSDWEGGEDTRNSQNNSWNIVHELQPQKSLLPELPSEDSVRLLRLRPGLDDGPIHADFEIVRINQIPLPLYEALSYTSVCDAADPSAFCPVYLGSYWDVFHVPPTCGKALRHLRHPRADRLLWVDALCIDHARLEEKNSQVRILREVFSRATKVLAYIGEEQSDINHALSFLKQRTFSSTKPENLLTSSKTVGSSLSKLLAQPYFSRLWVLQETLMARELKFVCGGVSARWPQRSFDNASEIGVPSWLLRDSKWYPFTAKDLLNVLVEASKYQCTDPRDKVFAVIGSMANKPIDPDYRLPTESVYVGIAAYFVKDPSTVDVLALAVQKNNPKYFDLPSWVPDWSQSLSLPSLDTFLRAGIRNDPDDSILDGAICVKFVGLSNTEGNIKVSSATGTMRLRGFKLAAMTGEKNLVREYTHIKLPSNGKGAFIISIPHQNYEIYESDSLFLLNGYRHPVILREITSSLYSMVAACILSIEAPSSKLFVSWYRRQRRLGPSVQLSVSELTSEEDRSLQQLYSRLEPTHQSNTGSPTAATIRTRALRYWMLPHTTIQRVEKYLRVDWYKWNQELGWMFRDQSAVWQFITKVNRLCADERTGEDRIDLRGPDLSSLTGLGRDFSTVYF
ncbi:heterokaryon incompatibility protein-domain-containing protein [Aspergillus multicolor]|uniref:heterokaryon incompatibility protein-domain-containing protein n=1 Tax=Aspergillus multicolor TaxID=41759 RepID=UPI003CCDFA73